MLSWRRHSSSLVSQRKKNGPFREFATFYIRKLTRQATAPSAEETLVLSIARQLAPDAVIREYEYRRSNRQVFVGVLPAFVMAIAAAAVNPWSSQGGIQDACELAAVLVGLVMIYALCASANYQERVAQSQLLDTAFTALWQSCAVNATPEDDPARTEDSPAALPAQPTPAVSGQAGECTSRQ